MTSQELAQYTAENAEMHRDRAKRALEAMIQDANDHLRALQDGLQPRQSVGGSCLNSQHFDDAERALTLYAACSTFAALAEVAS